MSTLTITINLIDLSNTDDIILGHVSILPDTDSQLRVLINKGEGLPSSITTCNGLIAEELDEHGEGET